MMRSSILRAGFSLAAVLCLTLPAAAHRQWMLPSATVLSGGDQWVTVDAAVSNDLFYFEHVPLRLDSLSVMGPDNSPAQAENVSTGKYRSTFDVHLKQPGTYRISVTNQAVFGSYTLNGEQKRFRAMGGKLPDIPETATNLRLSQAQGRIETFVTSGKPTEAALKPTGKGLELVPETHPNNLTAGEEASFGLVLDGKPAAGIEVEVVPGGNRYRQKLGDWTVKTDESGRFKVKWSDPGMYWLSAEVQDDKATIPNAKRRASWTGTFEVLPQ
jgi:uncharacterized GH25 family protein